MVQTIRRREQLLLGTTDAVLRSHSQKGTIVRFARGSYLPAAEWVALEAMERHRLRALEAVDRSRSGVVLSYFAACAI
ncbi:hypothetical protein IWX78_001357 [Mycetocola sp. CAN_C7]|uniref:hypothetical protein n=1 Tax=Mycetocola sp. CAN_C7 TaxID=2787724 RepID=UPI0018C9419F